MIELKVKGKTFRFFSTVNVTLKLDTIASTFSFTGLKIDSENSKILFKPLTYYPCEVWFVDEVLNINQKLITGTILNPSNSVQRNIELTNMAGYSLTGVFEDVNIPPDMYPLQFDGLGLDKIAKKICDKFGIQLFIFDNAKTDAAKAFTQTKAQPEKTIKTFLSEIARARNITLAHDNLGRLLLYKVLAQIPPKVKINETDKNVIRMSCSPNGQAVHSEITVIKQSSTTDTNSGQATVKSPFVTNVKRPKVQILRFGENIDCEKSATAIASSEAKAFPVIIEYQGWTIQNFLIRSGFYIEVEAPSIFWEKTKMVVESISFNADAKNGRTLSITAVLPCVYTGVLPGKSPFK